MTKDSIGIHMSHVKAARAAAGLTQIVSREVVYESWILAGFTRTQLTTADNRAG
jgi:hypothetical protein